MDSFIHHVHAADKFRKHVDIAVISGHEVVGAH
jgi:hypothetical protein